MIHELIYTSAPQGLDQGAFGFCTVQRTSGLDRIIQRQLEALSGLGLSANVAGFQNGQITLATSLTGPEGLCRVLSRMTVAGEDYSGRSNLVAHHLVIPAAQCPACGPASLARASGVLNSVWDGRVAQIAPRRLPIPSASNRPGTESWRNQFGDAAWAAVVLSELARLRQQPVWVIVPDGSDSLKLIDELLSCLHSDERWTITFSTEYQPLPAGTTCTLRFISASSPLVRSLSARNTSGLVDLTRLRQIPAEAMEFASRIRAGQLVRLTESAGHAAQTHSAGREPDLFEMAMQESRSRRPTQNSSPATFRPTLDSITSLSEPLAIGPPHTLTRSPKFKMFAMVAIALSVAGVCAAGTLAAIIIRKSRDGQHALAIEEKRKQTEQTTADTKIADWKAEWKTAHLDGVELLKSAANWSQHWWLAAGPAIRKTNTEDPSWHSTLLTRLQNAASTGHNIKKRLDELKITMDKLEGEAIVLKISEPEIEKTKGLASQKEQDVSALLSCIERTIQTTTILNQSLSGQTSEDVKSALARISISVMVEDLALLRQGLNDKDTKQELQLLEQRLASADGFAKRSMSFRQVMARPGGMGLVMHLQLPIKPTGAPKCEILLPEGAIPERFQHVDVTNSRSDKDADPQDQILEISFPENVSPAEISLLTCLHLTSEFLDEHYVCAPVGSSISSDVLCLAESMTARFRTDSVSGALIELTATRSDATKSALQFQMKENVPADPSGTVGQATPLRNLTTRTLGSFWNSARLESTGLVIAAAGSDPGRIVIDELNATLAQVSTAQTDWFIELESSGYVHPKWKNVRKSDTMRQPHEKDFEKLISQLKTPLSPNAAEELPSTVHVENILKQMKKEAMFIRARILGEQPPEVENSLKKQCEKTYDAIRMNNPQRSRELLELWVERIDNSQTLLSMIQDPSWNQLRTSANLTIEVTSLTFRYPGIRDVRTIQFDQPVNVPLPLVRQGLTPVAGTPNGEATDVVDPSVGAQGPSERGPKP